MSHEYKNPDSWIKTIDAEVFRNMDYRFRVWQNPCDAYVNVHFLTTDSYIAAHPGEPRTGAPLSPAEFLLHYAYIRGIAPVPPKEGYVWESGDIYSETRDIFCSVKIFDADSAGFGIQNLWTLTPIDLKQVSYLLFPDGTKLTAP